MDFITTWRAQLVLLAVVTVAGVAGFVVPWAWPAATVIGLAYSSATVLSDVVHRRFGVDVLATLSLAGTLLVGEYLAGAVVSLMLCTGQVLEAYAGRRAHRDLDALLAYAPRMAYVRRDEQVVTVPVDDVATGDLVLVRTGDVVPVDGRLSEPGEFDESVLTGESLPVGRAAGDIVRSGVRNAGAATALRALRRASDSAYAGVVRLAEQAMSGNAPVARLADRFAAVLVPVSLAVAAGAWWWSGDPVRAVAVLVTATPCPLLLAVPIAVTAGMSASSRHGVVVRDGAALERLGTIRTAVLDKTGTLTEGVPSITDIVVAPGCLPAEVLADAAAVERWSSHVLAAAVLSAAERARVPDRQATGVTEVPGVGARGVVAGRTVSVGRLGTLPDGVPDWARSAQRRARLDAVGIVWVSVADRPVAALLVRDEVRPEAARTLARLRAAGVRRFVLVTGDRREVAEGLGPVLGLDAVVAEAAPEAKVDQVRAEQRSAPTMAVGDGINDAPALVAADVGVAVATSAVTATSQVADAVLTDGGIDRLAVAVETARRARSIAVQSAVAGIGLCFVAMGFGAAGLLAPAAGALVQELIDVLAIGNALRALHTPHDVRVPGEARRLIDRFRAEHADLRAARSALRRAADALSHGLSPDAEESIRAAHRILCERLLPHERAEERELYPAVAPLVGGRDGVAPMSRSHAEIELLAARLGRHLAGPEPLSSDQVDDLRATLYGLDAVLTLHFAQEEQDYFALAEHRR